MVSKSRRWRTMRSRAARTALTVVLTLGLMPAGAFVAKTEADSLAYAAPAVEQAEDSPSQEQEDGTSSDSAGETGGSNEETGGTETYGDDAGDGAQDGAEQDGEGAVGEGAAGDGVGDEGAGDEGADQQEGASAESDSPEDETGEGTTDSEGAAQDASGAEEAGETTADDAASSGESTGSDEDASAGQGVDSEAGESASSSAATSLLGMKRTLSPSLKSTSTLSVLSDASSVVTRSDATQLRTDRDRTASKLPPQTIVMKDDGALPLTEAEFTSNLGSDVRKTDVFTHQGGKEVTSTGGLANESDRYYGIWMTNPAQGSAEGTVSVVDNPFSLKWYCVAHDREGRSIDLELDVTKITVKQVGTSTSARRFLVASNQYQNGTGYFRLNSRSQATPNASTLLTVKKDNPGISSEVAWRFTYSATGEPVDGTYLFSVQNLDVADGTNPDDKQHFNPADPTTYSFAESMQFTGGYGDTVYFQEGDDPTSVMKLDAASGRVYSDLPGSEQEGTSPDQYRCGIVAVATGTGDHSFVWWGNSAATTLFDQYDGLVVRDKNDDAQPGETDQGLIRKTVDDEGHLATEDNTRTATTWRTTLLPWKGSATYEIAAPEGYRVTKVTVTGLTDGATADLGSAHQVDFGADPTDTSSARFCTNQDYDIVVTTARVPDASATVEATKQMEGRAVEDGEFTFGLYGTKAEYEYTIADEAGVSEQGTGQTYEEAWQNAYTAYVDNVCASSGYDSVEFDVVTFAEAPMPCDAVAYGLGSGAAAQWNVAITRKTNSKAELVVPKVTNDSDGHVAFSLTYQYDATAEYPITHEYTLKEIAGSDPDIVYDESVKAVTVVESFDEASNTLSATVSYADTASPSTPPTFVNKPRPPDRGGVRVKKVDANTDGALEGAEFTVESEDGETVRTMVSDSEGIASLAADQLPLGTYTIRETAAPQGYLLNEDWSQTFDVVAGDVVDLTAAACKNYPDDPVELPVTGGEGTGLLVGAAFLAAGCGIGLRRIGRSH